MAICQHCKYDIQLARSERTCPHCGKEIDYHCYSCHAEINPETAKECDLCHWFKCPSCGKCADDCPAEIVAQTCERDGIQASAELISQILARLPGQRHKECDRHVLISHGKINNAKIIRCIMGWDAKSTEDQKRFAEHYQRILSFKTGHQWTINTERQDGTFGNELRSASYYGICLGTVEQAREVKTDHKNGCIIFRRIDGTPCPFFHEDIKPQIFKDCPNCGQRYDEDVDFCENKDCTYKRGKNKGQTPKLRSVNTGTIYPCSKPRIDFKEVSNK